MRSKLKYIGAVLAAAVAVVLALPPAPASAHGETAQEAFLRMGTVAFWDVKYSAEKVAQGEELTITGTAKILETYPEQLAEPKLGFIGVIAPGPTVVIKERTVNGAPAPMAIEIEKGGVYQFKMVLQGRRVGHWHVHPIFGIHGAGSLIGPGQYVDVTESAGGFTNEVKLLSGKTADLENIGMGGVTFWNVIWLVIGFAWLLYWIVPKPTVTRLPVTSQIPLNTDGGAYGLITKKDHRVMNIMMGATIALVVGGMVWQAQAYPDKMPQQVLHFAPEDAVVDAKFVTADASDGAFDPATDTVTAKVKVTNTGTSPASVESFMTSTLTFPVAEAGSEGRSVQISPATPIAPGETRELTMSITDEVWAKERLMPVGESRMQLTGVLRLQDEAGHENFVTIQSFVTPSAMA
ncbi:methane monooxygenase/ammonia monooxygenase subunit B [Nocardioides sp. NBC_00368]|uniref:methane monooxygenase/ammonia monooxygenase subunit B n=1 Tax=Nocardioides sp. NBC_00368 TaxID=2976000 RepID=UPI002E2500C7